MLSFKSLIHFELIFVYELHANRGPNFFPPFFLFFPPFFLFKAAPVEYGSSQASSRTKVQLPKPMLNSLAGDLGQVEPGPWKMLPCVSSGNSTYFIEPGGGKELFHVQLLKQGQHIVSVH